MELICGCCLLAVWEPMAAQLGGRVRVLAYNQRSYAGSDGAFDGQKEGGTDAAAAYLEDLVGFVDFAVDKLGVPGIGADGKGGVALLVSRLLYISGASPSHERRDLGLLTIAD